MLSASLNKTFLSFSLSNYQQHFVKIRDRYHEYIPVHTVCMYVCMYIFYIWIYIVCMSGFDLIHTYSSDALAQGILKSFFAFTHFLMPLPKSEPVAPNRPRLSGKVRYAFAQLANHVCMYVYMYWCMTTSMYCLYVGFDYIYIDVNALTQRIKSFLASHVWSQAVAGARTYGTDSPAITSQPR